MFCYQCEQTPTGGCKVMGVCGKNETIASLQDTIVFGLKGIAAYRTHAAQLGYTDSFVDATTHEALYMTLTNSNFNEQEHLEMAMKVGKAALRVMELLDEAHTNHFGVPEPVHITQNRVEGKAIVVTGHNLFALEELLKQTEGKGIHIYTHSEMLPAHGYPQLKKYKHLKGNIGKAWYDQRRLFDKFTGAILATTNCVMPIKGSYADRFFSYDIAGLEGVRKIENDNFDPLIEKALELPEVYMESDEQLLTGFHHNTVLSLAPEIIEAVKAGRIKRFFVIAGCDAPGKGGEYYRELAMSLPMETVILTTSCGKFRFNDVDYGVVPETQIPRYIDLGQCNNSISTIKIAAALADAFQCEVNELPISIVLSWFEQKAVAILLGLFSLGIQDIRIGPKAPEFISPGVLQVLQETFGLKMITTATEDMNMMLS
ncbi:hydroxylamine reductase [Bacillus pseudomycoides]|uniref:Hydroxylamine reductase n=1 Tax=Bacillus pseudomycoides TaxID=64104 RepID=A0AA91ZUJ9_9BACI|nr:MULTISPECIES: hydroxylamine reductase [Bacillus]PEB51039.1 hydroxylamine reductase [Bacillus sp. AFS098217]PED82763.1 hydroxylamine reductase [Bacillus pseudomycoides]PEU15612.1 hydroxylamine reductase [Bacillus sp. AFS014408]PEU16346.1 hydroxylamine reductase [Bacillus sp. AFS019443]PFW65181.1 hydroxylamine reductase [Bacillus sp. AFS075034]